MFVKEQTVRNFTGVLSCSRVKIKPSVSMPAQGFRPLFGYPNTCDGISRCRWGSSKFPKCRQRNRYS